MATTPDARFEDDVPVTICVTTRKRPELLGGLLRSIVDRAEFDPGTHLHEVLVIEGDPDRSAESVVAEVASTTEMPMRYVVHQPTGLARARARALAETPPGGILAFADDDEEVDTDWPAGLIRTMRETGAHLVAGHVVRRVPAGAPAGPAAALLRRTTHPHGAKMIAAPTANLAIDVDAVRGVGVDFDPAYDHSGGEDSAFTSSAVRAGLTIRWSEVGVLSEHVPAERLTESWMRTRARHGAATWLQVQAGARHPLVHRAIVVASAIGWALRGVARRFLGAVTGREVMAFDGKLDLARVRGAVDSLRGSTVETYGRAQN